MRVLAVLLAACLLLGCVSRPAPERRLHKRDAASSGKDEPKPLRDFQVVDEMLSTLDQCFHVLQKAVDDCGSGADSLAANSLELHDEKEESSRERTGIRKTDPPPTSPPTIPLPDKDKTVIIVHGQEEVQEQTAEQQGIVDRDKERGRTDEPQSPTPNTVVIHIDRNGNEDSDDESADSESLRKGDSSLLDRDNELGREDDTPPPTSVVVIHVDREDEDVEEADASSQSLGKDRDDDNDELPTPNVIVLHINRKGGSTSNEEEDVSTVPPTGNPPPSVVVIHTGEKAQDASEEAEIEGLRRIESTSPPTQPPTQPSRSPNVIVVHHDQPSTAEIEGLRRIESTSPPTQPPTQPSRSPPSVIVIHHDQPSTAEIESDVEYAMQYWLRREPTEPPTHAPPTAPPRGPIQIIIIPDAGDQSIDEVVSQVYAYSLGDKLRFRDKNEEDTNESPPTEAPTPSGLPDVIIVIDRRHFTVATTETPTEPPKDSSHSAIKIIQLAAQQSMMNNPLKPVKSQAKGDVDIDDLLEDKDRIDLELERVDLDDFRENKDKFELELEKAGMFMFPEAETSSRGGDKSSKNKTKGGTNSSKGRNKATDDTDSPTEDSSESATIETDTTSQTSTMPDTEAPTDGRDSQTDSNTPDITTDTEGPSDTSTTDSQTDTSDGPTDVESTDGPTDTETTHAPTDGTDSQSDTDSTDTPTDATTQSTESRDDSDAPTDTTDDHSSKETDPPTSSTPEAEAGEWPMESVFFEQPVKTSSMDKAVEDYLHFRRRRQESSDLTAQECLQLFGSFVEKYYADKMTFLNDKR